MRNYGWDYKNHRTTSTIHEAMSEQNQDHPRQDIIEFLCGGGTYDSLWWHDTPKDKRPTYWWRSKLRDYVAEFTKENERLKEDSNKDLFVIGSQLQQIESLTEQVEGLNKVIDVQTRMLASKQFETPELDRLREREKELVEALRARYEHLKWLKDVNTTPPSVIDEINFLQSLLSKFEEPNQS